MTTRGAGALGIVVLGWMTIFTFGTPRGGNAVFLASGKKVTSKAVIAKATAAARKWQSDAELYAILGTLVDAEGKAENDMRFSHGWSYTFASKKANKAFFIELAPSGDDVGAGEEQDEAGVLTLQQPLSDDFMDSDRAAKAAGYSGSAGNFLLWRDQDMPTKWRVGGVVIDAKTGEKIH